jgi:hypothetical protein
MDTSFAVSLYLTFFAHETECLYSQREIFIRVIMSETKTRISSMKPYKCRCLIAKNNSRKLFETDFLNDIYLNTK